MKINWFKRSQREIFRSKEPNQLSRSIDPNQLSRSIDPNQLSRSTEPGTAQSTPTHSNPSLLRKVVHLLVNVLAECAIWLDYLIANSAKRLFNLLPNGVKCRLRKINHAYVDGRNRLLQIGGNSNLATAPSKIESDERGDVPGWVLVVLMTTGLVTALWTIAAPRLSQILKNSLDAMNNIR